METPKEKAEREKRGKKQIAEVGYVSLRNRLSPDEIEDGMRRSGGLTRKACRILDCGIGEFYALTASGKWAKTWREIRREIVAKAEDTMVALTDDANPTARFQSAKFLLERLGGDDGYGKENREVAVEVDAGERAAKIRAIFSIPEDSQQE